MDKIERRLIRSGGEKADGLKMGFEFGFGDLFGCGSEKVRYDAGGGRRIIITVGRGAR